MRNKGFTLIELLAVIVILAIIALIAVPTILDIITDARVESKKRSIDLYGKSIELAIARRSLTEEVPIGSYKTSGNTLTLEDKDFSFEVEYDGAKVECDFVRIYEDGTISLNECKVDGQYVDYAYGIYTDNSGANKPELVEGLTAVIYDDNSEQWKIADIGEKWYDYDKKEWANAVILSETGKGKKIGDTLKVPSSPEDINDSDVLAMFVWIPRYEYKMPENVNKGNPDLIDVNFIGESASVPTDGYVIHTGFTFGKNVLSGIWIGKFETSHTILSSTTKYDELKCMDENCEEADNLRILPNVQSLRYQKVSPYFYVTRAMSRVNNLFEINKNTTDSHMMKNSEWGAVAYLSHSQYGKDGEVYINNCSSYITGIGADNAGASGTVATCNSEENKYNGSKGVNASTTGNVYGIYDMSGGAFEYVMGVFNQTKGASEFNDKLEGIDEKYYDNYTTTTATDEAYNGHALGETQGWYGDFSEFVFSGGPFFDRGGFYGNGTTSGVFRYGRGTGGNPQYLYSFRVVLASSITG